MWAHLCLPEGWWGLSSVQFDLRFGSCKKWIYCFFFLSMGRILNFNYLLTFELFFNVLLCYKIWFWSYDYQLAVWIRLCGFLLIFVWSMNDDLMFFYICYFVPWWIFYAWNLEFPNAIDHLILFIVIKHFLSYRCLVFECSTMVSVMIGLEYLLLKKCWLKLFLWDQGWCLLYIPHMLWILVLCIIEQSGSLGNELWRGSSDSSESCAIKMMS